MASSTVEKLGAFGGAQEGSPQPLLPLVIDLDGSLIRTDLLWEGVLAYVARAPWRAFLVISWLLRGGRAGLKMQIANAAPLDVSLLPVNGELAAFAGEAAANGRSVHLATAADSRLARAVAARFAFIERVFATEDINLKGALKGRRLQDAFPGGFAYAGDSRADLAVWRVAEETIVVEAAASVHRAASRIRQPSAVFPRTGRLRAAWKTSRPHQWAKNALVFVPPILGGVALVPGAMAATALAFVALCLIASATYVINDLVDISDDRRHWTKRHRPLASGALPIGHGIAMALAGLAVGLGLGALAGGAALLTLLVYLGGTLAYSLKLKQVALIDVLVLAGLFTLRLVLGAVSAGVVLSPWLLTFSMFLFLSLSLAKRHTELARAALAGRAAADGRGYRVGDVPIVLALGIGALLAGVVVFVLYLTQEAFVQAHLVWPRLLWAFPPLLFLLGSRIWLLSSRGELDDDPVAFAVKDRTSLLLGGAMTTVFAVAWSGLPWS